VKKSFCTNENREKNQLPSEKVEVKRKRKKIENRVIKEYKRKEEGKKVPILIHQILKDISLT
jgi:hypothetical protein